MIPELERYQGVVLRQLVTACPEGVRLRSVNEAGRADAFAVGGAAFLVKHSGKRMSPWRFTYQEENVAELVSLSETFAPVWVMLVCGVDGVVALSSVEILELMGSELGAASWIRVSRGRNEMYRVGGPLAELQRAKPRGVEQFIAAARAAGKLDP